MLPLEGRPMMVNPKICRNIPYSEFPNGMENVLSGSMYAHFERVLHWGTSLIKVKWFDWQTSHREKQIENEVSRTRNASQWKSNRVEGRFQKRIYINLSIIKMVLCQIIKYLYATLWYCLSG